MKENNNMINIYAVLMTVVAIGLLVFCITLTAIKDDLEKQVLVLRSQVKRLKAGPIAIPVDNRERDQERLYVYGLEDYSNEREEANDTKRNSK